MKPSIYVYFDLGSNPSFPGECALRAFRTTAFGIDPSINVQPITPDKITADDTWQKDALLLCMPGGASTPYAEKLNGAGNASIRRFVEKGGTYMGICAGAYYAASKTTFRYANYPLLEKRHELELLPAVCEGPIAEFGVKEFDAVGTRSLRAVALRCQQTGALFQDLYWGGPRFHIDESNPNVNVLYRYDSLDKNNAAVISVSVGRGRAILSGIHPEVTKDDALKNAADQLPATEYNSTELRALFTPPFNRAPLLSAVVNESLNGLRQTDSKEPRPSIRHEQSASIPSRVARAVTGFVI